MKVVAFTGMPGAGKSEAVEVALARGIPVVRMGDLVRAEVRRRGLAGDDATVGAVANEVRKTQGMDAWAARTSQWIRQNHPKAPVVVVDGVRNWEEVDRLRKDLGSEFRLVAITAAPQARVDRLIRRGRADDPKGPGQLEARDEREMGWGIARAIAMADTVLTNAGALDEFKAAVKDFFDRI
jgi:dephospho-CoA kinase